MSTKCEAKLDAYPEDESVCTTDECTKNVIVNFVVEDCGAKADVYFDLKINIINIDTGENRPGEEDGLLEHIDGGIGTKKIPFELKKGEKISRDIVLVQSFDCNCFE